ncbi:AAA family ATPase [Aliivibrio fischeri]|uniref:AAA family ATPase n=1 Tax=Aliivibrio fischeri TaxID=668 RepID=UPI00084CA5A7|nr:hypothetical protein [Aliivibrio fischeri]OED58171.1 hypothetical protein BEI47_01225 [Aliivibrio fischeri]
MINFDSKLNLDENKNNEFKLVLFYETEQFKNIMIESLLFEGVSEPVLIKYNSDNIAQYAKDYRGFIIMIEMLSSGNILDEVKGIEYKLPPNTPIIIVGTDSHISLIRNLKNIGYYYLFFPIDKFELVNFIKNVHEKVFKNNTLIENRKAKKIAILGSKGGVGTSFLASEISKELSKKRNSTCMLVDHGFFGGNLDIILNVNDFKRFSLSKGNVTSNLDLNYASTVTTKINENLSLLSITSNDLTYYELEEYVNLISSQFLQNHNFIIDDMFDIYNFNELESFDVLIFVMDQSISSVREAARFFNIIIENNFKIRSYLILNQTKPEKYAEINIKDIKKYIKKEIDVICPFDVKVSNLLAAGSDIYSQNSALGNNLNNLVSLILGEKAYETSFITRLIKRK